MGTHAGRLGVRQWRSMGAADESDNDDALVAAAKTDRAAFALLYRRYLDPIYRYCYRRLGDRAPAEDATSQVFERALNALPRHNGREPSGWFRPWLFTIARNTVNDVYRAPRREEPIDAGMAMPDGRPGPEEFATSRAEAAWVRGLLAHLTPGQRQVVELRLAGLTDGEIAEVLRRSPGSVRTAQYRALLRLRSLIETRTEGG